ncbi:DUF433 domain-containing protein [Chloroflexota bacterium]
MITEKTFFGQGLYSPKVAAHVAQIKYQNFQAWSKANLLHPVFQFPRGKRYENVYTYLDLLLIRLIKRLRDRGFKTKKIKKALDTIYTISGKDLYAWTKATIIVDSDLIVAIFPNKPEWNPIAASKGEQKMEVVFFPELMDELKRELLPNQFRYVEIDPNILGGIPVIKGTRIPTNIIYEMTAEQVNPLEAYPSLTKEQVNDANKYEEYLIAV